MFDNGISNCKPKIPFIPSEALNILSPSFNEFSTVVYAASTLLNSPLYPRRYQRPDYATHKTQKYRCDVLHNRC
jgi:hypothetical protein